MLKPNCKASNIVAAVRYNWPPRKRLGNTGEELEAAGN